MRKKLTNKKQSFELIKVITLSANGNCIVKAGEQVIWVGLETGEICSFDIQTLDLVGSWKAHDHPVNALSLVRNSEVWSASDFGEISIWNINVRFSFNFFLYPFY